MTPANPTKQERLKSLDLFRGITMFLLILEGTRLYNHLVDIDLGNFFNELVLQFHHHPWHGLRFWDLIQPFFMTIVGVAMPFSYKNRLEKGYSRKQITRHIVQRCIILFFFGIILHCGYKKKLVWELWNVLTQLSFTILVAYILMNRKLYIQLLVSLALILLSDFLYRYTNIPGFNEPFIQGKNFGSYMDMVLMGKLSGGGWVAINAIPTAAHTIWGVIIGKLLLKEIPDLRKIKLFVLTGIAFLVVGYTLDSIDLSPIIKRICSTSFIFVSGGWTILSFTFFYWLMDVRKIRNWGFFFILFGINPIFIYMFSETLGHQWLNGFVHIFVLGGLKFTGFSEDLIWVFSSICTLVVEAYILYFLYKRKIFFKI